jgi:molybdate transport system substrate-binding protein
MSARLVIAAAAALVATTVVQAAEIRVLASGATKEAYVELAPKFELASGHRLNTTWAGTAEIKKRLAAGEVYDLVIMASYEIDDQIKEGKIVAGSRTDLMKSGVAMAVPPGAPKPDISTVDALKKVILNAKTIGYSSGPSGVYLLTLLDRLGIAADVKPKLKQTPSGVPVGTLIANKEVEIGFQQVSELIHFPNIAYVGPLPAEVQQITTFSAGVHKNANETSGTQALVKFLTGPIAKPVIRKNGMEPG